MSQAQQPSDGISDAGGTTIAAGPQQLQPKQEAAAGRRAGGVPSLSQPLTIGDLTLPPLHTFAALGQQQITDGPTSVGGAGARASGTSVSHRSQAASQQIGTTLAAGRSSVSTVSTGGASSATPSASVAASQQGDGALGPASKECRKCGVTKDASAFQMDRHNVDGLQSYCRSCKAERARERRSEKDATPPAMAGPAAAIGGRRKPVRRAASRARVASPEPSPPWGGLALVQPHPLAALATPPALPANGAPAGRPHSTAAAALPPPLPGHKRCSRCREAKPRSDFHRNRTTADGLQYQCRTCHQEVGARSTGAGPQLPRQPVPRQPAAKRRSSVGSGGPRKPKSRRLSDFDDEPVSPGWEGAEQDGFALLQRAAAVASAEDRHQQLQQQLAWGGMAAGEAALAAAPAQGRKGVTVTHKMCSKCHSVKAASEFWKNKSTPDGLQWFCRLCQTRVCNNLKDAARLRTAATPAAQDAQVKGAAAFANGGVRSPKRRAIQRQRSHPVADNTGDPGALGDGLTGFSGLHALAVVGSNAEVQGPEPPRLQQGWALHAGDDNCNGIASPPAPAIPLTLQDVLKLDMAPPLAHAGSGFGCSAAAQAATALVAVQPEHATLRDPGVGLGSGAEARADGSGPAAELSIAQDADSGTSGDGRSEHAAALGRASTAGSNSLEAIMEACSREAAVTAVITGCTHMSRKVIMEACCREAGVTAERTRLSRELLAVAPLLMPDVLRLRTAPGDAAMNAMLMRDAAQREDAKPCGAFHPAASAAAGSQPQAPAQTNGSQRATANPAPGSLQWQVMSQAGFAPTPTPQQHGAAAPQQHGAAAPQRNGVAAKLPVKLFGIELGEHKWPSENFGWVR